MAFNPTQFFEYGKGRNFAPNTFIGGVASVINTPALLAAKLKNHPSNSTFAGSNIKSFTIVGNDIQCYIGVDYRIEDNGFSGNTLLTYYRDLGGMCKGGFNLGQVGFVPNCLELYFPNVPSVDPVVNNWAFSGTRPNTIYMPNCLRWGFTELYEQYPPTAGVFRGNYIGRDTKIYVHPSMATINAGGLEGDLAYAQSLGCIIIYVQNFTAPNPITDLTIGNVYGTALQVNFTAPTGSTNAIDFYEVWVNGRYNNTITASGGYATNLNISTVYQIEVKPVDIYYNKSTSNIVTQATASTYTIPTANIVSSWQFENNLLDSYGSNNGTGTAITYASGLVGQAGVFNGTTSKVLSNSSAFDFYGTQQLSMVAVINLTTLPPSGKTYGITAIQENAQPLTVDKTIRITETGQALFYVYDGAIKEAKSSAGKIAINTNYVLVGTFDGTTAKIYINNVLEASIAASGSFNFTNPTLAISSIANPQVSTNGKIDEVTIFNKALTATEVSEINAKLLTGNHI